MSDYPQKYSGFMNASQHQPIQIEAKGYPKPYNLHTRADAQQQLARAFALLHEPIYTFKPLILQRGVHIHLVLGLAGMHTLISRWTT